MSMQITDGTTTMTFTNSTNRGPDPEIDESTRVSSGGRLKGQTSGERFVAKETVAVTGAELRSLMNLLTNDADGYYYTPASTPPEYQAADFPMEVKVVYEGKSQRAFNGSIIYYVDLDIRGVAYQ